MSQESRATRFGSHFLGDWRDCPQRWYWRHVAKLVPAEKPEALSVGTIVHAALERWYTGRDPLAGVKEALVEAGVEKPEQTLGLIREYLSWEEALGDRILRDEAGPVVEREFELDLGYRDYLFTTRIDAVVEDGGRLYALEHKTSSASYLTRLLDSWTVSTQAAGQMAALVAAFPDREVAGIKLNVLVKDRGARSTGPRFLRHLIHPSVEMMEKWRVDAIQTLREIDEALDRYRRLVQDGMLEVDAARMTFVRNTNQCVVFRRCPYYDLCRAYGREERLVGALYTREEDSSETEDSRQT